MDRDTGYEKRNGTNVAGKGADPGGGNGVFPVKGMAAVCLALTVGLCAAAPTVQAEALQIAGQGQTAISQTLGTEQPMSGMEMVSRGNLVYRQGEQGAQIYAADFLLLRDRISTMSDTLFEPACYTHTHRWEYFDMNGETHTRHCESCGSVFDLVGAHKAERREGCTLSHEGKEFSGIRYTCVCGYQWEQEEAHTLFFEAVDENTHRSRCRLDGTGFCEGYEPVIEEHYAYYYKACEDGRRHERICMDCGYQDEEECCFDLSDTDGGGETDGEGRRCWCGNTERPDAENGEGTPAAEADGGNGEAETEEDSPAAEAGGGNEDTENESDSSDKESGDETGEQEKEELPSNGENGDEKPDAEPKEEEVSEDGRQEDTSEDDPKNEHGQIANDDNVQENGDTEQGGRYEE